MTTENKHPVAGKNDVAEFLQQVAKTPQRGGAARGRLIFALDATASRGPTWATACDTQAEMFNQTASLGGLSIQLCYYRGFAEFCAGTWVERGDALEREMAQVHCLGGHTQIGKVLDHALAEHRKKPVAALVFVGDATEEDTDQLCSQAGALGLHHLPVFVFQEGKNPQVERVFRQIARLSGGAWAPFDSSSASQLGELLRAVAVYAAGGQRALQDFSKTAGPAVLRLTQQIR